MIFSLAHKRLAAQRLSRTLGILTIYTALAGCAGFDPYNLIGRHGLPADLADNALGTPQATLSRDQRQAVFTQVWDTIDERYYDPQFNGANWHAALEKYRPLALQASDDQAFWEALNGMTGELGDSHTRVESPREVADRRRHAGQSLGLALEVIDNRLAVTAVNGEADAWWAGVRPGMIVRDIAGEDALHAWQRFLNGSRDASTQRARQRHAAAKFNRSVPEAGVAMTFERADGTRFSATLKRRLVKSPPQVLARILPSGFGYVRFSNFLPSLSVRVFAALHDFRDAPGIVIDLRNNTGGSLFMARDLADAFFNDEVLLSRQLTRTGAPVSLAWGMVEVIKSEYRTTVKRDAFRGRVVILANASSASASEYFGAVMQELGRASVIGEATCGCLMAFLDYTKLPGGGALAYSEVAFTTAKGKRIEGGGVLPDKSVPLTLGDLQQSRDRALEEAVELLRSETGMKK
jgi:carboxyl-terminal processing protease